MNDKELLELAAKAAGIDVVRPEYAGGMFLGFRREPMPHQPNHWNPLVDDGDALRLAVKLGIFVKVFPAVDDEDDHYPSFAEAWQTEAENPLWIEYEVTDPYVATRRAIVRAAAEIGKEMK